MLYISLTGGVFDLGFRSLGSELPALWAQCCSVDVWLLMIILDIVLFIKNSSYLIKILPVYSLVSLSIYKVVLPCSVGLSTGSLSHSESPLFDLGLLTSVLFSSFRLSVFNSSITESLI